ADKRNQHQPYYPVVHGGLRDGGLCALYSIHSGLKHRAPAYAWTSRSWLAIPLGNSSGSQFSGEASVVSREQFKNPNRPTTLFTSRRATLLESAAWEPRPAV